MTFVTRLNNTDIIELDAYDDYNFYSVNPDNGSKHFLFGHRSLGSSSFYQAFDIVGNRAIIYIYDSGHRLLYGTDTNSGEILLDFHPSSLSNSFISLLSDLNTIDIVTLYGNSKYQIWATDGTSGGSRTVLDLTNDERPYRINNINNYAIVETYGSSSYKIYGINGLSSVTAPLIQFDIGGPYNAYVSLSGIVRKYDIIEFYHGANNYHEYWATDGTVGGTKLMFKYTGYNGIDHSIDYFGKVSEHLMFVAHDNDIYTFISTDGRGSEEIFQYDASSSPYAYIIIEQQKYGYDLVNIAMPNRNVYFATDGTKAHTHLLSGPVLDVYGQTFVGDDDPNIYYDTDGQDTLLGFGGADQLYASVGNDSLDGGSGSDVMVGGIGDDRYQVDDNSDVITENSSSGTDAVWASVTYGLSPNLESLILTGMADIGGTGNLSPNPITGNDGNNTLDGGAGGDTLTGGLGNDLYLVDDVSDVVVELADQGEDSIYASVSYILSDVLERLILTGTADISGTGNAFPNIIVGNSGRNALVGGAGDDTMNGGLGDDTYLLDSAGDVASEIAGEGTDTVIASFTYVLAADFENLALSGTAAINGTGNGSNNMLSGNDAANTLTGLAGNDVLDGGLGVDTMLGGAGNDTYLVDSAGDVITEIGGQGTDVINASVTYTLGASIEVLILTGSGNIDATGNSNNNALTGNDGNNSLNGGLGSDLMTGGLGDDTCYVNDAGDKVVELDGGGTDTVFAGMSYSGAGQYIENITLLGSGDFFLLGNGLGNTLRGNSGNNDLNGSGGADTMIGGGGSDTYTIDNAGDVVTETGSPGIDVVNSRVTFDIGTQYIEIVNLNFNGNANVYGSTTSRAETLNGNTANNILDGRSGADTMAGGRGNDTYYVDNAGDLVTENTAEGTDLVNSYLTYTLGANLENLTLLGAGNLIGTGNALGNIITGTAGNNKLLGLDGNDWLDGGLGSDTLTGGLGNDTYSIDDAGDVTVDVSTGGTGDTVHASVSYALGASAYIEIFNLTGAANINATGNNIANSIAGNSGNNRLDGGNGADILTGGAGKDTLIGGSGADTFFFGLGSAQDVINDFKSSQNDLVNIHAYSNGVVNGGGVTLTAQGSNTLINLGGGNTILVLNIIPTDNNFLSHILW